MKVVHLPGFLFDNCVFKQPSLQLHLFQSIQIQSEEFACMQCNYSALSRETVQDLHVSVFKRF